MPLFTVDHNNIMGASVAEAGTYNVRILNTSEYTQSKSSGNDMLMLNYEVSDGKYKGGQIRYHYLVWNADSQEHAQQSVRRFNTMAVAAGAQDGVAIDSLQQLLQALIGKEISVTVDWEEGNNGNYNLWVKYFGPKREKSEPNGVKRPQINSQPAPTQNNGFAPTNNGFGQPATPQTPFDNNAPQIDPKDLPFD